MAEQMAAIDFSPLERLLGSYEKGRITGVRGGLAGVDPKATPDTIAQLLFAAGDLEGGMPFASLANTRAQQEWNRIYQGGQLDVARQNARTQQQQNVISQQNADTQRLAATRDQ